jgi:hypothetical protein
MGRSYSSVLCRGTLIHLTAPAPPFTRVKAGIAPLE